MGGLAKLAAPKKASTIERNVNRWKESIETKTRDLASDQTVYDIGQIIGDAEVVAVEWIGAVKLVKGIGAAAKGLPALLESLTSASPLLADGGILAGASEGVGIIEGSSLLVGALDILFNYGDFKDDINKLKSDAEDAKASESEDAAEQKDSAKESNNNSGKDESSEKSDSKATDNTSNTDAADGNTAVVEKTTYSKSDLDNLKYTENFKDSTIDHIFEGNMSAKGNAQGYHYEGIENSAGKVISGTESAPNKYGVYKAKVEVNGVAKSGNGGESTFFPKEMSPQQVVDSINEAYSNRSFIGGNTFRGVASSGMEIELYLDQAGKIISAFPIY